MGIIITKQADIDAYFASNAVNQSSLKDLKEGMNAYLAKIDKKKKNEDKAQPDYFIIGGGVDTILTGEEGEYEKKYYVSRLEKMPSDAEKSIVESVFDEIVSNNLLDKVPFESSHDAILAACNEFNWQANWKDETRIVKILEKGTEYFYDLSKAYGKIVISLEIDERINKIVKSLKEHPRTDKYFDRGLQTSLENYDFYYQLPMYFTHKGVECKALMDLVVVKKDEKGEIINVEPIDLKTMSGQTIHFIGNFKTHRYDLQAAWYTNALTYFFKCAKDKIKPFKFIVESTTNLGTPLVYVISPETLYHGEFGAPAGIFKAAEGERHLYYPATKGFEQLLDEYIYYSEQGWEEDAIIENSPTEITLDWHRGICQ